MTDQPIVRWGPLRQALRLWQVVAAVCAVVIPAITYGVRVEVFIQNEYKQHETQAAMTADTNRIVRLMAQRMGIKP